MPHHCSQPCDNLVAPFTVCFVVSLTLFTILVTAAPENAAQPGEAMQDNPTNTFSQSQDGDELEEATQDMARLSIEGRL